MRLIINKENLKEGDTIIFKDGKRALIILDKCVENNYFLIKKETGDYIFYDKKNIINEIIELDDKNPGVTINNYLREGDLIWLLMQPGYSKFTGKFIRAFKDKIYYIRLNRSTSYDNKQFLFIGKNINIDIKFINGEEI